MRAQLLDQILQRLGSARVADHDVISMAHGQPCHLAPDMPRADQSDCLYSHDTLLPTVRNVGQTDAALVPASDAAGRALLHSARLTIETALRSVQRLSRSIDFTAPRT